MKWFNNILLSPLQYLDYQLIAFYSSRSCRYAPQKTLQFDNQSIINYLNISVTTQPYFWRTVHPHRPA